MPHILVLDDRENIRRDLGKRLTQRGYTTTIVSTVDEAKRVIKSQEVDFAIVDLKVDYQSEFGGIEVVNFLKRHQPLAKAIVLSAYEIGDDIRSQLKAVLDGNVYKGGTNNYILEVLDELDRLSAEKKVRSCFVIMPFSNSASCSEAEWTDIFENTIRPAVEKSGLDYKCARSEAIAGNIIDNIIDDLNRADLVIADLTDRNANVFYELGVRHSLRDSTVLITQDISSTPFDLRPYAMLQYDWKTKRGRDEFRKQMKKVLTSIDEGRANSLSPVRKYLLEK